jgi:hypothetical protein
MRQDSAARGFFLLKTLTMGLQPDVPLQFCDQSSFYVVSRSSLEGNVNAAQGSIGQLIVQLTYFCYVDLVLFHC